MDLTINIKNIGKLADAKVRIANFTVFAGPNNSGKSFVSKLLYSLFNAMNANHAQLRLRNLTQPVVRDLSDLSTWMRRPADLFEVGLAEHDGRRLEEFLKSLSVSNSDEFESAKSELLNQLQELRNYVIEVPLSDSEHAPKRRNRSEKFRAEKIEDLKEGLIPSIDELEARLRNEEFQDCINAGIRYAIEQNLIHNFQIPALRQLRGDDQVLSQFEVENGGKFEISESGFEFEVEPYLLRELQRHSNVIYLESPVYWKLKDALRDAGFSAQFMRRGYREALTGVPGYFYDLVNALSFQRTGDMAFGKLYESLTSDGVIGGRISISESGDLSFLEGERSFSLPVTAMGIVNLGILALLIERKVLDKDAFVFLDEPEAHLHPSWQIIAAESLFELSRQGVHVVIATHSVDILKWLEVQVKTRPEYKDLIALNRFPSPNTDLDQDFETRLASIKQELTKPFSDLYVQGL